MFFLASIQTAYGHIETVSLRVRMSGSEDEPKISAQTVHDRNSQREDTRRAQEETHDMMPFSPEGPRETTETARRLTGEIKFPGTKKNSSRRGEIMATVNVGGLIMRVEMMRNGFEKQDSMNTF